jgi:hypothetical protein
MATPVSLQSSDLCYTPDGCCPPDPTNVHDLVGAARSLLPPGEAWRHATIGQDEFYAACANSPPPAGVSGALEPVRSLIGIVDSLAAVAHCVLLDIGKWADEADPLGCSPDMLDYWAAKYGVDRPCSININECPPTPTTEIDRYIKAARLYIDEKFSLGCIPNKALLDEIGAIFGASIEVFLIGYMGYGVNCSYVGGARVGIRICPATISEQTAICTRQTVFNPPASPNRLFFVNCDTVNMPICSNPLIEVCQCVIEEIMPKHLDVCFLSC